MDLPLNYSSNEPLDATEIISVLMRIFMNRVDSFFYNKRNS